MSEEHNPSDELGLHNPLASGDDRGQPCPMADSRLIGLLVLVALVAVSIVFL